MRKLKKTPEAEVQNCVPLKKYKKHSKYIFVGAIFIFGIIMSSILEVSVSNSLTTEGTSLGKIQDKIVAGKKENMLLREQVYAMSSYTHIASQAATLGFVEAKSPIFLNGVQAPLAIKP